MANSAEESYLGSPESLEFIAFPDGSRKDDPIGHHSNEPHFVNFFLSIFSNM